MTLQKMLMLLEALGFLGLGAQNGLDLAPRWPEGEALTTTSHYFYPLLLINRDAWIR
jgi:hypothetical protein